MYKNVTPRKGVNETYGYESSRPENGNNYLRAATDYRSYNLFEPEPACKPGSVLPGERRPFIWDLYCYRPPTAHPTVYPEGPDAGRVSLSYSASLRRGFAVPAPVARPRGGLLPRLFTLACARRPSAVCFLRHFPSGRPARVLPGLLPCAARTFLTGFRPRGRPAGSVSIIHPTCVFFNVHSGESPALPFTLQFAVYII